MFYKGQKIVYPMYGAGIIEDVEQKSVDGVSEDYYVIKIPNGNLKIKVAAKKAQNVGLRQVNTQNMVLDTMKDIASVNPTIIENWSLRYKENMLKIKNGKFSDVASVVRSLILRERERGLSSAEKKMLNSAKQIILSEIIFSYDIDKQKAEEILENCLINC